MEWRAKVCSKKNTVCHLPLKANTRESMTMIRSEVTWDTRLREKCSVPFNL